MRKAARILPIAVLYLVSGVTGFQSPGRDSVIFRYQDLPEVMPGTRPLDWTGDPSARIMDGAHRFIEEQIRASGPERGRLWSRDFSSRGAYEASVEPNRGRLMKYIGLESRSEPPVNYNVGLGDRNPPVRLEKLSAVGDPELVAETSKYRVYQVRWPVLNRVHGEGLLLQPGTAPVANVVAIPDADQTPEQLVGLAPGVPAESQFPRHLAENGFQVLIPVLVSRSLLFAGEQRQQTYREWIYRQAFHMGRHVIGYEVQKVLAAIDWFEQSEFRDAKIGVAGYFEGGLLAFHSAAVDPRIDAVLVSGYFDTRQRVWDEPIYRNVWGLLTEFGDAEIASLIGPRPLVVEYSRVPDVVDQIERLSREPAQVGGFPFTGYKGRLHTPRFAGVQSEFRRIDELTRPGFQPRYLVTGGADEPVRFGSRAALERFAASLGVDSSFGTSSELPTDRRRAFDAESRQVRQVRELEDHVQWLLRVSDQERNRKFLYAVMPELGARTWSTRSYHPYHPVERFTDRTGAYRKYFWEEILGRFDQPMLPPDPRTRKAYDRERWTGYEVVLDVYSDLSTMGVLLIPKDIGPGERRPVVVVQHGRNGVPRDVIEGNTSYNDMAAKLADQGFVVYVPQGLYRGEDRYRWLDRKANAVKKTLFSFMIAQHDQTLRWLGGLPFVDKGRIGFYGKSYGGEAAMRIPAVLEGYSLSIASGDFGDWTRKVVDTYNERSFMNSFEWEMPYFDMGSTFSYAEMAYLILPRPFMVERGHDDLVQPDEWVAYEYAKVKYLYDQFNLGDRTEIEYFNGGHASRNEGTFEFLHKHLRWP